MTLVVELKKKNETSYYLDLKKITNIIIMLC